MSREQSVRSPAPSQDASIEVPPAEDAVAARLTALVTEAREERWARRADITHSITSLLEGLTSHPNPGAVVPTVHRLMEGGLLEGLEDGTGQSATVAATRALVALGYPHALEVSPEHLAALNRWESRTVPTPWVSVLGILFVAAVVQLVCITLSSPGIRHLFGASAEALAGGPVVEPPFAVRLERFIRDSEWPAFQLQALLNGCAFVYMLVVGGHRNGRRLAMRAFQGLGVLGLLVALVQLQASGMLAFATCVSAGASFLAGWLLKE